MNMRFAAPEVLVDVSGVADLQGFQVQDDVLRIGAMSRMMWGVTISGSNFVIMTPRRKALPKLEVGPRAF